MAVYRVVSTVDAWFGASGAGGTLCRLEVSERTPHTESTRYWATLYRAADLGERDRWSMLEHHRDLCARTIDGALDAGLSELRARFGAEQAPRRMGT